MIRLLVGFVAGLLLFNANAAPPSDFSEQIADLKAQNARIKTHPRTGAVRLIGAWPQAPLSVPSVNEVTRADFAGMAAVKHFGPMFGLTSPEREMRPVGEKTKPRGGSRHRYRQLHKGIPVLTGELLVNLDVYRRVISMSGEISIDLNVDVRPDIHRGEARRLALETVAKWYDVQKGRLRASVPELWIVDPKILKPGDRDASLAWRIEVTNKQQPQSIREQLFIDAKTAGITLHINLIEPAKNRKTYTANNTSSLPGTLVCDESDPGCAAGDSEARNAHVFAGDTYDFYFNEHGRDSLDDAGQTLISTVHYSDYLCPNAFWNGSQMVYCAGLAVDDVVGHELSHGITENTSQLLYYYESGAINESLSDIWGEFVDLSNSGGDDSPSVRWLIGEDLTSSVGVIRDMADPPAMGDPDKMSSPLYYTSSSDNGGVHFNSGINNKAAYLMTDGDIFNGYTVNGLGIGKVADIYYEVQTNLLTSGSDYADLHTALNQACQNLIGIDGITSVDCLNVQAAIDAVEMDTDPQDFHPDAPICIGGDPPDDLFFDDLESGTSQWDLVNVSGSATAAWIHDFGYAASGEFMLWGRDSFVSTDATAEMNVDVPLPASAKPYLHFKHSFAFEASFDFETFDLAYWDGGFLEYSIDAGVTWSDAGPLIESGQAYNATIQDNPANPNANHPAFGDESHGYVSTRLDLSVLKGQSVRFRWHTSTDGSVSGPFGWVLDDVRVYTCANEPPPPAEVAFSDATYSVSEAGVAAIITVSRTGGASTSFTVDYATADLSASAGADYTATSGTLSFADGEDSQSFSVPVLEDALIEGNEAIVLTLSAGSGAILGAVPEAMLSITDNDSSDVAWIDDALPAGATPVGSWNWVSTAPAPYSGGLAHQSTLAAGFHQHYFNNATAFLQVQTGDTLYAYVYLDPDNPPSELMLSWYANGSWDHRAYWGADLITHVGTNGTDSRRYMGPLPPTGEWVRLEVPASQVGLEGAAITGMAFSLFDGRATWDTTGITSTPIFAGVTFSDATYSVSEAGLAANITVNRTGGASSGFTVDYATADGSAAAGTDYTATSGTLSFADGEDSQSFSVPILEDGLIEGNETIVLTLSGASGATLGAVPEAILTITDNDGSDVAWIDDALPAGARQFGSWTWVSTAPTPYSGGLAHQSTLAAGFHQHYFTSATAPLQVQTGDTLYAYVYLDPDNPPSELMLSWYTGGSWVHNAYWGADLINVGTNGTDSRRYMGPLPATGQWVRLEVPASQVGLEGAALTGMAFSLFDGRATWDTTGITSTPALAGVTFSDAAYNVSEAGLAASITVSRTGGASSGFTVDYATADGTASAGADYTATNGTLSFADGEDSQSFSVPVLEDALIEGNETIALTLSGASGATLGAVPEAILTIADNDSSDVAWIDDALPAGARQFGSWNWVSSAPPPYSGGLAHQSTLAAGFHQHYFTGATVALQVQTGDTLYAYVYLDPDNPPSELMLSWYTGGSWVHNAYWGADLINVGTNGTDSRRYMGPLPATGQWVRLEVPASQVGLEGAAVTGMAFSLFDGRATWDTTGITSTPPPAEVAFSDATYSVSEAGVAASITVSRTGSTGGSVMVDYATADGSASAGTDYTAVNGTLSFADGEASQTFSVPVLEDGLIEGNETIVLTLSGASGASLGAVSEAMLTIADNDSSDVAWIDDALPAGATQFGSWNWVSTAPPPYSGGLAHQSTLAAGFHQHYFTSATAFLQVQTGETLYAYVYLDPDNPPSELMLSWYANGSWDHRAYWGADLITHVGTNGTNSRRYMGPLPPTGQWVRLEVPASAVGLEGAAVTGMAFSLFDGRATWDTTGVTSTPPAAEVAFSDATYSVSEADGAASITVSRTGSTSGSVTVDYATADGSASAGADYTATSGTLSFADGEASQTFSVPILEDGLIEGNETIALTLSGASGASLGAVSEAMLTITDNDSSDVAWIDDALPAGATPIGSWNWVSTAPAPYSGGLAHQSTLAAGFHQHYFTNATASLQVQTGDTLYAYVYLDPDNPPSELMLSWYANGSWDHRAYWGADLITHVGTNGTDSRRYMGPLPAIGQWVRLEVPASQVGLEGAAVTGMAFSLFDGRATWDTTGSTSTASLATVAFSDATYSVSEAGVAASITVSRTGGASSGFTVDYATADGTASAGADYTATNGTLSFADGEDSQSFSVPVLEDALIEGNETIALTLSGASGATLGAVPEAILTITDNDSSDVAWIDDALPSGARQFGSWNWVSTAPPPYSGSLAHQSTLAAGFHQHYFTSATAPLQVQTDDTLYAYVYLDPDNPPSELMLSWYTGGSWVHNAYWGADLINVGTNGTDSRRYMGPLPATGQWVRLEVPASQVGLEGAAVTGMAFSLFDGRATWDTIGSTPW